MLNKISKNLSRQNSIKQIYYNSDDDEYGGNNDITNNINRQLSLNGQLSLNRQITLNRQASLNRQVSINRQASLNRQSSKYNNYFNSTKIRYGVNLNDPKPLDADKYLYDIEPQEIKDNNKNSLQRKPTKEKLTRLYSKNNSGLDSARSNSFLDSYRSFSRSNSGISIKKDFINKTTGSLRDPFLSLRTSGMLNERVGTTSHLKQLMDEKKKNRPARKLYLFFEMSAKKLQAITQSNDPKTLDAFGGATGLALKLQTKLETGLPDDEALDNYRDRIDTYGLNKHADIEVPSLIPFFLAQFYDFICLLLFFNLLLSFMGNSWIDPVSGFYESLSAFFGLFLNAFINTFIEFWKQRQYAWLENKKLEFNCCVLRESSIHTIHAEDVLVGDVVLLQKGDKVPADGIYIDGHDLWCDESVLLESDDYVPKSADIAPFLYAGSKVVCGRARMLVTAVGYNTAYLFSMDNQYVHDGLSPLFSKLSDLCASIGPRVLYYVPLIAVIYTTLRFLNRTTFGTNINFDIIINWLVLDVNYSIIYVLSLLYVCIPQGLPFYPTTVWSYLIPILGSGEIGDNALIMSQRHFEGLSMVSDLLVDKYVFVAKPSVYVECVSVNGGPIMNIHTLSGKLSINVIDLIQTCLVYNLNVSAEKMIDLSTNEFKNKFSGDVVDVALAEWITAVEFFDFRHRQEKSEIFILKRYDEDLEDIRRFGCLVRFSHAFRYFCQGAAEYVLPLCDMGVTAAGQIDFLNDAELDRYNLILQDIALNGLSPIVLAYKEIRKPDEFIDKTTGLYNNEPPEDHMVCLAIIGLRLEVNPNSVDVITKFKSDGMNLRMVSNDHPDSTAYLAAQVGILTDGTVTTAYELEELDQLESFKVYSTGQVFSRFSPAEKYNLLRHYQDLDKVVLATGYKPLDAPTLLQADVSISMESLSCQACKDVAGIHLLHDDISILPLLIRYSKFALYCCQKQSQFQFTIILSLILFSFVCVVSSQVMPLHAFHLIWINIFIDSFAPICLTGEPMHEDLEKYLDSLSHFYARNVVITPHMRKHMIGTGVLNAIVLSLVYYFLPLVSPIRYNGNITPIVSVCFNLLFFLSLSTLFNCRYPINDLQPFFKISLDIVFISGAIFSITFQLIVNFAGSSYFLIPSMNYYEWLLVFILAPLPFLFRRILMYIPNFLFLGFEHWTWENIREVGRIFCSVQKDSNDNL